MNSLKGYFMEPQNFSVNDGDGIRTIIFLAGCHLRCKWCANPESFTKNIKVAHYNETCRQCGKCTMVCPLDIGINLNDPAARVHCNSCGLCTDVCLTDSRKNLIYQYSIEEILKQIEKQELFYRYSGGGVTFSGGEPTLQTDVLRILVNNLYDKAINLAIETSGYFEFHKVKDILQKLDLIFIDIKHMDGEKHKLYTGVDNTKILNNIKKLNELKIPVVVRIPTIVGVNATNENIRQTAKFVKNSIDTPQIELLPYHFFGTVKYEALGLEKPTGNFKTPTLDRLNELENIIRSEGVEVVSYK